jgi:superfamily II DNA or RNA helicase
MTKQDVEEFLQTEVWQKAFASGVLVAGKKIAHGRLVAQSSASILDTGDVELVGYVMDKEGHQHEAIIAIWKENGTMMLDASCSCDQQINCHHSAATLIHLARGKGERLDKAFGDVVGDIPQQSLTAPEEPLEKNNSEVSFLLRIERRPAGDRLAYLPDIYAHAYAKYKDQIHPLDPTGNIRAPRDRTAEMQALQTLYALDLMPGAEQPPPSLKKSAAPPHKGALYAPDKQQWSHPDFYWQRFQHEAIPALEKRGWAVQLSPHVGLKPLIFRTDTWNAEIVEEGKGWFNLSAGFEIDGEKFELQPILATLLDNDFLTLTENLPLGQEFLVFLPDGRGIALPVGRFRHILTTLGQILEYKFTDGPIKLQKLDAALLAGDTEIEIDVPDDIEEIAERVMSFTKIDKVVLPDGLKATLRDYQLDGFYWMQFLAKSGFNGILADDMGLGKTLQTLTHILAEKESGRDGGRPSLVVAPTSVVVNWQREAAKFAPGLKVLILQGPQRHQLFSRIADADIVLSSFALIPRDLEYFKQQHFHQIILDEAQHIKNPSAKISQAVRELSSNHRLCLSGTPIENHLGELWSQFSFLMPGLLGSNESFNENYRNPIEKDHSEAKRNLLNAKVGPLILRRTKHDVAKELPPKTEILHSIELHTEQKDLYETVRSTMDKQVRQAIIARGGQAQIVFLDALLKLRQICCHPTLLKQNHNATESAKFDYLVDLLETLRRENHRVLIFSQFTSMLSLIEAHLIAEDVGYLILTGATKDRQSLVERFQGGEGEVFLISLKAGGTGLTLTGADTVIHYDPWWNPAAENQATDRAYRIGQDKPVMVHKLICQGTVEERIQQMQKRKNILADNILDGSTQNIDLNEDTMRKLLE